MPKAVRRRHAGHPGDLVPRDSATGSDRRRSRGDRGRVKRSPSVRSPAQTVGRPGVSSSELARSAILLLAMGASGRRPAHGRSSSCSARVPVARAQRGDGCDRPPGRRRRAPARWTRRRRTARDPRPADDASASRRPSGLEAQRRRRCDDARRAAPSPSVERAVAVAERARMSLGRRAARAGDERRRSRVLGQPPHDEPRRAPAAARREARSSASVVAAGERGVDDDVEHLGLVAQQLGGAHDVASAAGCDRRAAPAASPWRTRAARVTRRTALVASSRQARPRARHYAPVSSRVTVEQRAHEAARRAARIPSSARRPGEAASR